jgi:hypothetical protein
MTHNPIGSRVIRALSKIAKYPKSLCVSSFGRNDMNDNTAAVFSKTGMNACSVKHF